MPFAWGKRALLARLREPKGGTFRMLQLIRRVIADDSGASFTEYAILVAIVGAAVVVAGKVLGGGFNTLYTNLTNLMTGWVT